MDLPREKREAPGEGLFSCLQQEKFLPDGAETTPHLPFFLLPKL
jgi:hypothetical protein